MGLGSRPPTPTTGGGIDGPGRFALHKVDTFALCLHWLTATVKRMPAFGPFLASIGVPREPVCSIRPWKLEPLLSFQSMNPADGDVYFNTPGVASVKWDQAAQLVMVEWEGLAGSSEFKELLDAEIRALQQHRGSRVLADCRQQNVLNPADQERANKEWLPRALAAGLKRFAVVLPKSGLA